MSSASYNQLSDLELVAKFKQSQNKEIIGELFQRYTHLVFGVCMKYLKDEDESKDAVMQVFEKLLTDLQKHEIMQFKSWLYSVAKNHCLMHLRSQKTTRNKEEALKKDLESGVEYTSQMHLNSVADEKELQLNMLEEGIKTLKEDQRICIELFYLQRKCYQEVAEETGFDLKQVKSFIQNGKRNLKLYMTQKNG